MEKISKIIKLVKIGAVVVVLFVLAIIALLIYLFAGVLGPYYNVPNANKWTKDYDPSMALVSEKTYNALEAMDDERVELGINADGNVVFKHPYKAFGVCKKEYKNVWKYADKELGLKHLSRTFYVDYTSEETISAIVAANPDVATDAAIYREILLIYSHSYNKHR